MGLLAEMFFTFFKIGAFTFGGGYAMIPLIENQCVEKKAWFSHDEFMNMTVIAESTPGPIAINCATYVGYKRAGLVGAVCATLGVVVPSFLIILIISSFLHNFLKYEAVRKCFAGIRVAVAILITQAGYDMVKNALKSKSKRCIKIVLILVFFAVMLAMSLTGVNISLIYLLIASAFAGTLIFKERGTVE